MLPFELTKDTPYLALSGELWSVFYEYFNRNWSCYKGFLLYTFKDNMEGKLFQLVLLLSTLDDILSNDIMQIYAGRDTFAFQIQQPLLICVSMNNWNLSYYIEYCARSYRAC